MIVYICGIPGVGKSTIANMVETRSPLRGRRIEKIRFSEILCTIAEVESLREYRSLPEDTRRTYQPEMFRRVYEMDRADPSTIRLFDRHVSSWNPHAGDLKVRKIMEDDMARIKGFILLTANPEIIFLRRVKDYNERFDRHLFPSDILMEAQRIEIEIAKTQSRFLDIPLLELRNDDGEAPDNCHKVTAFLSELIT